LDRSSHFDGFRHLLLELLGVDAQKARRYGIFPLLRSQINGRKRCLNGPKMDFSVLTVDRDMSELPPRN